MFFCGGGVNFDANLTNFDVLRENQKFDMKILLRRNRNNNTIFIGGT